VKEGQQETPFGGSEEKEGRNEIEADNRNEKRRRKFSGGDIGRFQVYAKWGIRKKIKVRSPKTSTEKLIGTRRRK